MGSRILVDCSSKSLRALAVECLPRDLPDKITVDVSALNIGDSIHVRDIAVAGRCDGKTQSILPRSPSWPRPLKKSR